MEFANKTDLVFEPGLSSAVPLDAVAAPYVTPPAHRCELGDLARLRYVTGVFRYRVRLSNASAVGAAVIRITDGVNVVASSDIDLSSGAEINGRAPAALSLVNGSDQLRVELDVTEAADAGVTAEIAGVLAVTHPVIIGGC